ncbi:MAG TPA: sensor histidine kinase [Candidatus Methanoperedens sp.]
MSIRSELVFFFLVISLIPLSLVVYISYEYSKGAIRGSVEDNLEGAADNTGYAIDNWMDARKDDIRILSQNRIIDCVNKGQLDEIFRPFENEHQGDYREFFVLDTNGSILFSSLNRSGNYRNETFFIEAAKGKLFTSDVSVSEAAASPDIIIANPIKKNGTINGILAARVSMENLYRMIENLDIGQSGEVFIVNNKGEIIFHRNRSITLLTNINNNFAVSEVTYEMSGKGEYINYRGEQVLGSYHWLPLYRWGLIAEKNIDEASAGALQLGRQMLLISSLATICVVFLALVISRRLTKPIESLENGAHALVEGRFEPISTSSKNEIGELTEIFNKTASELLDIRKKLEARIENANKDLEEKNKELVTANDELKKLDVLKSDFISLVSHELKTPLAAIRISAEYLDSLENVDQAVQKEMLEIIIRNIDRQTRLINDILDLSKIEAGKIELQFESVDLREIGAAILENVKQIALKKQINISMTMPEILPNVLADRE